MLTGRLGGGQVLQGSMLRVLNLLERHAKDLAAFKYLEALKARGRAQVSFR